MANYSTLKAAVEAVVKTNGEQAITGANMQTVLLSIINSIGGGGYIFEGVATPSTNPGTPDQNVFYLAGAGTYANFGTSVIVPPTNIAVFKYNGSWTCEQVMVENGGVFDISAFKAVGGTLATYADLSAALGTGGANVPEGIRKGGMSIKFVQSSDNKYVQARLMANTFTTDVTQWQIVESTLTISDNIPSSKGTINEIYSLFFVDIPDKNIKQIKELYLTGLNPANEYLVRVSISGTSKTLQVRDSNNETTLAIASIINDVFVVLEDNNDSGISGYAILTTTDIINISLSDCAKINVQNVSNIDLSPSIKERLAINYPKFDDSNNLLKDSGLAGKFYGYPFLIPEYSQRNDVIMSAIKELYLTGIDKKEIYYVRYHIYNDRKYIHIYDNTKTAVAAAVYDGNNLCYIYDSNSSGIKGYVLVDGTILDSAASSNEYIVLANEYALDKIYSPIIQNRTKFIDITPISGNNYDTFALGIQELYIIGINDTDAYTIRVNVGTAKTFQIFNSSNTVVARGIMADNGKVVKLFPYNSTIHGYIIYNGTISATTSKMKIANIAAKDRNNSPIIQKFMITDSITVGKSIGFYDYISLTEAVIEATKSFDKTIYVDEGVYDLEQEFKDYYGNDYFDNWTYDGATELGLMLKNRVHIIFSSKAKVVFNYTGNNADVMEWWSPFNAMPYTSDCYGFTLENLVIEASNCRYCVHDERNAQTDYYVNKYINCSMKIDNTNNTAKVNYSCLGGGLGKNGYIEIVSCKFEAVGLNTARNIFSYHNSKNSSAKSRLVIKDNYCVGLGTFKLNWHGTSTEITEALVCGNSFGSQIICAAETGTDVTENVSITAWNNEIRTT